MSLEKIKSFVEILQTFIKFAPDRAYVTIYTLEQLINGYAKITSSFAHAFLAPKSKQSC